MHVFLRSRPGAGLRGYSLGGLLLFPSYSEPGQSPRPWNELMWGQANSHGGWTEVAAAWPCDCCWPQSSLPEMRQGRVLCKPHCPGRTWASASYLLSASTTVDTYVSFKTQPGVTSSRKFALTSLSLSSNSLHCNEQSFIICCLCICLPG